MSKKSSPSSSASVDEAVRCPTCKKRFADAGDLLPKLLPACFHTICQGCAVAALKANPELRCPTCNSKNGNKLPVTVQGGNGGGVQGLMNNFVVLDLLPVLGLEEESSNGSDIKMHCDCCDDPEVAVSHCSVCSHFLCDFHVADHQKRRQTKDHPLVRVKDLRHSIRIAHRPIKCEKHDKEMEMYCEGCVKPVCTTCALLQHREHALVAIKEAVVQHKANLKEAIAQARQRIGELQEAVKANMEVEKKMHTKAQECRSEVNATLDKVVAFVNQRREQLIEKIGSIENEKVGLFKSLRDSLSESVASVDGCCAFAEKVTQEARFRFIIALS